MDENLFDFNKKYGFHDTEMTKCVVSDNKVVVFFSKGIYLLDDEGRETSLTASCRMEIFVDSEHCLPEDNVSIYFYRKHTRKVITCKCFEKFISKTKFDILFDYYSSFAKSILLKGYIGKYSVDFIVENITAVNFDFHE